jgi:hypothetical protein
LSARDPGADDAPQDPGRPGASRWWAIAFVGVAVLVIAATAGDYGVAWDETVQARYGELALDYFTSGMQDRSYAEFLNLRYYGALFEMVPAGIAKLAPSSALEIRHVCVAATWLLAILGAMRFAQLLAFPYAPHFAVLALATLPSFYGHAFQNSKDMPFAAAFTWSMVAIATWLGRPRQRWRDALLTGVAIGLALAVRVGGVLLLGFVGVGLAVRWALAIGADAGAAGPTSATEDRPSPTGAGVRLLAGARMLARPVGQALVVAVLAWGLMVATWPFAQEAPLRNPLAALSLSLEFPYRFPVLFDGQYSPSDHLPARYLIQLLVMKVPPAILGLALGGLAAVFLGRVSRAESDGRSASSMLALMLLVFWVVLPPVLFALDRPPAYDGLRHFLFVFPGVALLAACGASSVVDLVQERRMRLAVIGIVALMLLTPVVDLFRLHPYQMTYFNQFAGGVGGAWQRYETDYWATSYREAMEWIQGRVGPRQSAVVLVAANDYSRACAERYGGANLHVETIWQGGIDGPIGGTLPAGIDYYLSTTRAGLAGNFPQAPIVHAIGRDGAVFAVVRGRGDALAAASLR